MNIQIIDRRKRPGRNKNYGELLKEFLTGYLKFHDLPPRVIVLDDNAQGGLEIDYDPEYDATFNRRFECCWWSFEPKRIGDLFGAEGQPWEAESSSEEEANE